MGIGLQLGLALEALLEGGERVDLVCGKGKACRPIFSCKVVRSEAAPGLQSAMICWWAPRSRRIAAHYTIYPTPAAKVSFRCARTACAGRDSYPRLVPIACKAYRYYVMLQAPLRPTC